MPVSGPSVDTESYGEQAMAEVDLCRAVGETLEASYPGYDWYVGTMLDAGTVVIDVVAEKPLPLQNHAFLLHVQTLMGAGGQQAVIRAGGEMLERFGLPRSRAPSEWKLRAAQNGLDAGGAVLKSKH